MPEKSFPPHELIPEHKLLADGEAQKILAQYKVSRLQIPKIKLKDPALAGKGAKPGQMVSIKRLDGSQQYRLVVD